MKELNAWTVAATKSAPLNPSANSAPDQRLQRAEAEVRRLTRCMEMKDQQLCELRRALAHSATVHCSFEDRLQRELDSLRIMMPVDGLRPHRDKVGDDPPGEGIFAFRSTGIANASKSVSRRGNSKRPDSVH